MKKQNKMLSITSVFCVLLAILLSLELVHRSVYGGIIKEAELDAFFSKHLEHYKINELSRDTWMFNSYPENLPYLSRSGQYIFNSWYIEDHGVIPRWSKWSKRLDERYEQLTNEDKGVKKIVPLSEL